jgi:glutamate-1-semialdehyde 2,1-aminomutase
MGISQDLYRKAKKIIPGGTQLLSKRPEMFLPDLWPAYYDKAEGCRVWDLDGNVYTDMSMMGIGACILGYCDPDIDRAVIDVVRRGSMNTLNAPEEVYLAEKLLSLHPWAGSVRYARTGGEAMAIAVRIARASSGRDKVAFCGYHGWHDWYLSANLADNAALDGHLLPGLDPAGVPRSLKGFSIPFRFNDTKALKKIIAENKGEIGAIVLESIRNDDPDPGFIDYLHEITREQKIVFLVDEITAGFRLCVGGGHLVAGIKPDIAVFAKALGNGYPIAAIIGKENVLSAAQDSFISSTYWTERIGPTAALATVNKIEKQGVVEHLGRVGRLVQEAWKASSERHGVPIHVSGIYPLSHFDFVHKTPLVLKTLFTQLMLERGFLAATGFYSSYAHTPEIVAQYAKNVDESFAIIAEAAAAGKAEAMLKGPVCHSGFKRLN